MLQKPWIMKKLITSSVIFSVALSGCQPATEIPISPPTVEKKTIITPITQIKTGNLDLIQSLYDEQLLSSSGGSIVWEASYLTLPESTPGTLSWSPLDISTPNFILYTEFSWDSSDTGETACGVAFRENPQGDFYMSIVRKNGDGLLWLSKADQWQASPAESYGNYVNSENNTPNELILIAENERVILLINGIVAYDILDYSLDSGSISLITGTALDGNTCTFQNSWIWEINKSTQSQQASDSSTEPHDFYAGFTDNENLPFLILHKTGEKLGATLDQYSADTTGVIWESSNGASIVIFEDANGFPKTAVSDGIIIKYSNYTSETVDITIIYPDGNTEYYRTQYSLELRNRIASKLNPSFSFVSYTSSKLSMPRQQDYLDIADAALFDLDVATCVIKTLAASTLNVAVGLLVMADACAGPFIELKIKEGEFENADVSTLEKISDIADVIGCAGGGITDCLSIVVDDLKEKRDEANSQIASAPSVPPAPEPTKCKGKYNNCP